MVAGPTNNGMANIFSLVRYNTDGTIDSSFGLSGFVTTDLGGIDSYLNSIAIQKMEKLWQPGSYHLVLLKNLQ